MGTQTIDAITARRAYEGPQIVVGWPGQNPTTQTWDWLRLMRRVNGYPQDYLDGTDALEIRPSFALVGTWTRLTAPPGFYNISYDRAAAGDGSVKARFIFSVVPNRNYIVMGQWPKDAAHATDTPASIMTSSQVLWTGVLDQKTTGNDFLPIATVNAGNATFMELVITNAASSGYVVADAVKIIEQLPGPVLGDSFISDNDDVFSMHFFSDLGTDEAPLVSGQVYYYRMFTRESSGCLWLPGGTAKARAIQTGYFADKLFRLLPGIYQKMDGGDI